MTPPSARGLAGSAKGITPLTILLSAALLVTPTVHAFSTGIASTASTTVAYSRHHTITTTNNNNPLRSSLRHPLSSTASSSSDDTTDDTIYDIAILGSGPASCSLAALLSASPSSPKVVVLSKCADKRWVPNYGTWTEEWAALDEIYAARGVPGLMEKGVDTHWSDTDCFFGEDEGGTVRNEPEGNGKRTLGREYLRVSRVGLKEIFFGNDDDEERKFDVVREDVLGSAINTNIYEPRGAVSFGSDYTELTLKESEKKIRAKIVVDGTGAETSFTIRDGRENEGYQIAYGVECRVEGEGVTADKVGDYDRKKMTLFDYRSEAWRKSNGLVEQSVINTPTFNYVMPLSDDVIFFEETSLVANPAVSFQECKNRLTARLAAQGVTIKDVLEEEYCYIPMGGDVPRKGQRIIPIGAAAGVVHPSTGYQVARMLSSNVYFCDQIVEELARAGENGGDFDPDVAAARIIGRTWTPDSMRQRAFAVFGGDFLMKQNVMGLKGFFSGFFKLDEGMWAGFLAGWKNLPNNEYHDGWWPRVYFGIVFLTKLPPNVALDMAVSIVAYTLENGLDLIQSVTPLLGEPDTFDQSFQFRKNNGDVAAKWEAKEMMCACDRCEEAVEVEEVAA
eukprot:CAMPEP_0196133426 /NCGR_PEP_ID=MMETSP0910-20130528/2655_1 /TAXON_ID=49265 /ORGANISM="Thalassiosira rotula, Strain GSO102" /LENGTH=618 /DNA_ID=CAMNT_0041393151 /DNA_START=22 /DNA_END=1878 /DNA_ORIENTATION=+